MLRWVSPFGYPRISAYLQLPEAFRSLSRPSSAPDAKAFPLRSFSLDLFRRRFALPLRVARFSLRTSMRLLQALSRKSILWFLTISNYAGSLKNSCLAEIVFPITLNLLFPYCCLLITFLLLFYVQFSRCIFLSLKRLNEASILA